MVYRYSWIAGSAALLYVLYQLNGLLRPTVEGPPWQLVIVAALVLGVIITWTAVSYRLSTWLAIVINGAAALVAVARVSAPETTVALIPTGETFSVLRAQLRVAFELIRNGVEPVIPASGLVVILLVVFWAVGFLFAWGLTKGHPYVALVPPLVISLQFATMDRQFTSPLRAGVFVAVVAGALLAVTMDQRDQTSGRMVAVGDYGLISSRLSRSSSGLLVGVVVSSAVLVGLFGSVVPADGVIDWRSPTGLTGDFYGSVAYNPFIGIKQSLVSNSNTPVFAVKIDGDVPADQIYFRLLTMETYSGGQFFANRPEVVPVYQEEWESAEQRFAGPVDTIVSEVEIQRLVMEWLPSPYAPVAFASTLNIEQAMAARVDDASLRFEGGLTFEGMRYQVESEIPRPDVSVLALGADGELSPAFALAAAADENVPVPTVAAVREAPPDVERYLDIPEDLDEGVGALARRLTRNLKTPFEQSIALESWFRSDAFRYSIDIEPGYGASDLAAWLTDPDSPNYRVGYCENFATSMAIMARTLGIPSRVVLGFTPGTLQADGTIIVRDRNAHAWVELWMPTQGWVRFDPTPRSDGVNPTTYEAIETSLGFPITDYLDVPDPEPVPFAVRPGGQPPFQDPDVLAPIGGGIDSADAGGLDIPTWITNVTPWLLGLALVAGGIPILKWWRRRRRIKRLRTGDITAAWEHIVSRLEDLGRAPHPADTPAEAAEKVDPAMAPLAMAYARSLYGPAATRPDTLVDVASTSMQQTEHHLATRHSRMERLVAKYRVKSLRPAWWRRRRA